MGGEADHRKVIRVDLASGGTELRINDFGTLLHKGDCQVILPASYLVDLGYNISWKRGGCKVKHRRFGSLEVTVVKGCPLIPREVGLRLLEEYESKRRGDPLVSRVEAQDLVQGVPLEAARSWLRDRLAFRSEAGLSDVDQLVFLRSVFPGVDTRVLARACVVPLDPVQGDWAEVPWNRRLRRSVARASPGSVALAVPPFASSWKGMGRVVSVPNTERGLGSRAVFRLLMRWAQAGVLGGVVKGPAELSSGRASHEEGSEEELVRVLRLLLVFAVAQAVKDEKEALGDMGILSVEEEAQRRMTRVFLAMDRRSMPEGAGGGGGDISPFMSVYDLHTASFDQGCFGLPGVWETSMVTSSWFLFETLHEVRVDERVRSVWSELPGFGAEVSQPLVPGWSHGVLRLVQKAWVLWKWEQDKDEEVRERRCVLRKLTEEESYARHVQQDHVPYRKGCPICIRAQGRQRSHWRSGFPGVHSLSVDVAGPLVSGQSWDVEASGRDRGLGYRYFLAFAYTIPSTFVPETEEQDGDAEYEPSECGQMVPEGNEATVESTVNPREGLEEQALLQELDQIPLSWDETRAELRVVNYRVKGKQPEQEGIEDSSREEGIKGYKTLFLGVPIRSKRGREILPHIQGTINRLEASGFPVQRFHSDRAKELRSHALIAWIKDKGIHGTWTPGESPAGNRAELAVQALKSFVRKLFFVSELPKHYWPLALLHGSARLWVNFNEAVGNPQAPLLPFGIKIHARCRKRTGYDSQWESRTVEGVYIGTAPSTPGGHLVLLPEGDGHRVLLTNTVYPLRGSSSGDKRPRYRLRSKRSPPFALRVTDTGGGARCSPGGECSSLPRFWAEGSENLERNDVEGVKVPRESLGSGLVEDPEVGWDSEGDSEPESEPTEGELDGMDVPSSSRAVDREVSCGTLKGVKELDMRSRDRLRGYCENGVFSDEECCEVLDVGLRDLPVARRSMLKRQGRAVVLGLYGVGGFHGVSRATWSCPEVTKYLNSLIRQRSPGHLWTTLYISRNTVTPLHRDQRNAKGFDVWVKAFGNFVGGGLWIEGEAGKGPVCKELPTGVVKPGTIYDIGAGPIVFSGDRWHAPEAWDGESRWVVAAFVPRDLRGTTEEHWDSLRELGFPVEEVRARWSEGAALRRVEAAEAMSHSSRVLAEEWEVAVPAPFIEHVCDAWDHLLQCNARLCRLLSEELCDVVDLGEGTEEIALQLRKSEVWCDLLERGLAEAEVRVGALQTEVPLGGEGAPDQFLQTRTVGLAEARREIDQWREPAQDEIVSLETTNRAVDRVKVSEVDGWANEGVNVVQLPGKVVLTRKSGVGKRRCRAVCCGNYLPAEKLGLSKEDLYASGAEALSVKLALTFAAKFPLWVGVTIDVKSAFLYAPIRSDYEGTEERIVVKPPNFLVELGLLDRDDRWWIRKALYGLPTSPRDWGRYRDQEFRKFAITSKGTTYHLVQMKSDDALWQARVFRDGSLGEVAGILIVYVDDLAFLGPEDLCHQFIKTLRASWKTSEPEWITEAPVTFCGIELARHDTGYRMTQRAYVKELLKRYQVDEDSGMPVNKWVEPEAPDSVTLEQIREAQAVTGALLWLSTRTRPDLAYVVARCGQQATKSPLLSISLGRQALGYLRSTLDMGIDVPFNVGDPFADHGLLSLPRTDGVIELYTDASHSPGGEKSMQAVFIVWRGVPVAWEATRRPFTTL